MTKDSRLSTGTLDYFPLEILKEILCNVDSVYLPDMKLVCAHWYKIITDILRIKELPDTAASKDALCIFENYFLEDINFYACEAVFNVRNIVSKPIITKIIDLEVYYLEKVEYISVLQLLKWYAKRGGASDEKVRRTVVAMTGIPERPVKMELEDDAMKSMMARYSWYKFTTYGALGYGIIALHPDNKKFTILLT